MIPVPDNETLSAIKARGHSGSVLNRTVGPYTLSCVYRQCSAAAAPDLWYPETAILTGEFGRNEEGKMDGFPRLEWQGEGWASFLHLANNLNTVEEVERFLATMNEPEED